MNKDRDLDKLWAERWMREQGYSLLRISDNAAMVAKAMRYAYKLAISAERD